MGSPKEVYYGPKTPFVSGFVGAMTHLLLRPVQETGRTLLVKLASGREIQALEPGAAITLAFDGTDVAVVPLERKM